MAEDMAKGYWIAMIDIVNAEKYSEYTAKNGAVFAEYGAAFVVRGGQNEARAGHGFQRHVVLEFESYERAKACYDSAAYQAIVPIRDAGAKVTLAIVEGHA
ncbi:MAG: DUF1330 domain-containing protein [Pseudomonadota bacterium]